MSFQTKVLIIFVVVIAVDAIASLLSRLLHFDYTDFVWMSYVIYTGAGFWGAFRQGFGYGIFLGGIAGFTDSTAGWFVSRLIGPFIRTEMPPLNPVLIGMVIVFVTLISLAFGSVGAALCKLAGRTQTADA